MNKEEIKLNDKELHKAIDNLKGTQFLDAFCIIDWIVKTRDENKELQAKVNQLEEKEELHLNRIDELVDRVVKSQEKLNQLETNRDETIKLIKFEWEKILKNENYSNHLWSVDGLVIKEIISSLERGKE